jgi:hypothetical protein
MSAIQAPRQNNGHVAFGEILVGAPTKGFSHVVPSLVFVRWQRQT